LTIHTANPRRAFTLIELLVVVTIIAMLIALLLPAMSKSMALARAVKCLSNLRQQRAAMGNYMFDSKGVYPDHRTDYTPNSETDRYWATTILPYGTTKDLFHCPSIGSETDANGTPWTWAFTQDHIGYGYNGFFLGIRLYGDSSYGGLTTTGYLKMTRVVSPSINMCIGDTNKAVWGQSMWWPNSGSNVASWEGLGDNRHPTGGAVVFNDSHAELFKASRVNAVGDAGSSANRDYSKYWDPLMRP
jgi:prepilin-type N-terminal cleavage/methylation domain-containing protein